MAVAIPELLRFRERTGADRFDEMWEGVLHMTPSPSFQHQLHASRILNFFVEVWCPRTGGGAVMQMNVSTPERWDQDYRIPDIAVMRPDRLPQGEAMFVRPNVVFEIRSPGDETYEKLRSMRRSASRRSWSSSGTRRRCRCSHCRAGTSFAGAVGERLDVHQADRGRVAHGIDRPRPALHLDSAEIETDRAI